MRKRAKSRETLGDKGSVKREEMGEGAPAHSQARSETTKSEKLGEGSGTPGMERT